MGKVHNKLSSPSTVMDMKRIGNKIRYNICNAEDFSVNPGVPK